MKTTTESPKHAFTFMVPRTTWRKVEDLREKIQTDRPELIGKQLTYELIRAGFTTRDKAAALTDETLMKLLLKTKKPFCLAQDHVREDQVGEDQVGEDQVGAGKWTHAEFAILSAITTSVPVTMYADAKWGKGKATPYDNPQKGHLFFTNGPVLNPNSPISKSTNSEYYQLTKEEDGQRVLDKDKYNAFIRERLLPIFKEAQKQAIQQGKTAFVSIPGIGCGILIAGSFADELSGRNSAFKKAVYAVLNELTKEEFSGVIRIDMGLAHSQKKTVTIETNGIRVYEHDQGADDPGYKGPGILALPSRLGITTKEGLNDDQFLLCSVVAGDPTSYPGNHMNIDSSSTNEGAVGGSTDVVGLTINEPGEWVNKLDGKPVYEYHPNSAMGQSWSGYNKPFVGAENPMFKTVTIPAPAAAVARTPMDNSPLNGKGRAIVAIVSMLTLGLYPLLRYVQSLVTGKPFSWGLPDSMYTTHTLQVQDTTKHPPANSDSIAQCQGGAPCAEDPEQNAEKATEFSPEDAAPNSRPGRRI